MDFQAFLEGRAFDAFDYFGAHPLREGGVVFRTYAPNAQGVSIFGDFNGWHETPMSCPVRSGFYEIRIPNARPGQMYKYVVYGATGRMEHSDPYGFGMELRPACASIIRDLDTYTFWDATWMQRRSRCFAEPLNIYELHMGTFRRHRGEAPEAWYRYSEIADPLIEYLRKFHFTHVEFMPLAEHPHDGSWGYQQTGFFAPTIRYGFPDELMELIDRLHQAGFGAILDFVPGHFASDPYALPLYDGTPLYEYPDPSLAYTEWGTKNFMFARGEAASFVQSAANYWLEKYHFDGLRMDAISHLVYWAGDKNRGVNADAVRFLQGMNRGLHDRFPSVLLMAEDSTAYEGCTRPAEQGGLGFDYKWDLGWMHDTLEYFALPPKDRANAQGKLTFSMHYFYKERHLLPLSHDEVVDGKKAIADRFYGGYVDKLRQARAFYLYMFIHPGKKLNYMGNELAMLRAWDERRALDDYLLRYPLHRGFAAFFSRLGEVYQAFSALFAREDTPEGFRWISMGEDGGLFGIERRSLGGSQRLAAFFNFSDSEARHIYHPEGAVRLVTELHTEWSSFGGSIPESRSGLLVDFLAGSEIALPPFSAVLYSVR